MERGEEKAGNKEGRRETYFQHVSVTLIVRDDRPSSPTRAPPGQSWGSGSESIIIIENKNKNIKYIYIYI